MKKFFVRGKNFQKNYTDSKRCFIFALVFWYQGYLKYAISNVSIII